MAGHPTPHATQLRSLNYLPPRLGDPRGHDLARRLPHGSDELAQPLAPIARLLANLEDNARINLAGREETTTFSAEALGVPLVPLDLALREAFSAPST
mgnify:CR=1 FL=1